MMVVRSALRAGLPLLSHSFCTQRLVRLKGSGKLNKIHSHYWTLPRDLPDNSTVPRPSTLPPAPFSNLLLGVATTLRTCKLFSRK
jgi:hypothetical protein